MLDDGHEIYLISHRAYPHYNNPRETTEKWLTDKNINYTELVLTKSIDKSFECKKYCIDIMFDDVVSNCKKLIDAGVNTYLVKTKYTATLTEDLECVLNWHEIYEKVCDKAITKLPKVHVILDTDTNNEADDQFALAYLLKSKDRIILDAVTIAPYSHENDISIIEGIDKSYQVCTEIFKLCNENSENMIFKGSTDYFINNYFEKTDAIKKMVDIIKKNDLTYILGIGAITNIAILLKLYPEVKSKIKVVWLGGHSLMSDNNREYNFKQDVLAVDYVFNSYIDLTIIPCNGVASNLTTSIYELQNYFDIEKGLGKYLYTRFYNDSKHGITPRRVIWDISVVAYIINPYWFTNKCVNAFNIDKDLKYIKSENNNKINFITGLDQNRIYNDMFNKIGNNK